MEKKENLGIKNVPEELTAEDLEKVSGGASATNWGTTITDWNKDEGAMLHLDGALDQNSGLLSRP